MEIRQLAKSLREVADLECTQMVQSLVAESSRPLRSKFVVLSIHFEERVKEE
jgi:hypothetical protein